MRGVRRRGALNSVAGSVWELYLAAALSGTGAGAVYGTWVGNALKWFSDLRGLTAGLTAAGFGAGTAATVIPIREMILGYGYASAFSLVWLGARLHHFVAVTAPPCPTVRPDAKAGSAPDALAARIHAARNVAFAGILAALHHVRHVNQSIEA
jgi:MFS family permease